jgi:hypothetical protein
MSNEEQQASSNYFQLHNWTFEISPEPTNIIWANYFNLKPANAIKDIMVNLVLFFVTILLLTPSQNVYFLKRSASTLGMDTSSQYYIAFAEFMSIAIINSLLMPNAVYYLTEFQSFELKSRQESSRLNKYFVFLLLNTIILPAL